MQRFAPYLFDRLIDASPGAAGEALKPMLTLDQLKDTVARDVESLLNTRRGIGTQQLQGLVQVQRSVAAFGLDDFAARSMASTEDQAFVCQALERAIADHEPRLRSVRVELGRRDASTRRLKFSIKAMLLVHPMQEPVNFDAVLQTGTQHYAVTQARRTAPDATP
jgi:type VI secretion system protein ImpF